jgi:ribokinase
VDLVVAGGCTVDIVHAADGTSEGRQLGGSAIYAAAGARVWGLRAGVVAFRGTGLPDGWADLLSALEIDTEGLVPVDLPASVTEFVYDACGERRQRAWPDQKGPLASFLPADTGEPIRRLLLGPEHVPRRYRAALGAHLAPMHYPAQRALADALRPLGVLTLDPYPHVMAECDDDALRGLLAPISAFIPSLQEVAARFPGASAAEGLRRLLALGCPRVVVKLGRQGALVWDPRARASLAVPAVPVDVKDPTGAGDAFCGGVLAGLVEGADIGRAAARGAVSASLVVEDFCFKGVLKAGRAERDRRLRWVLERIS